MTRFFTLLTCLLLFTLPAAAQDAQYRLKIPTAAEYLAAIPTVLEKWKAELPPYYGKTTDQPIFFATVYEMNLRYSNDLIFSQSFELLSEAFEPLRTTLYGYGVFGINGPNPYLNEGVWAEAILKVWLRENPTDLSKVERLEVPGYHILVHPVDFNGDGVNEYWLDVDAGGFVNYLVLLVDSQRPGGYRFVPTPLYWLQPTYPYYLSFPDEFDSIAMDDLNGDNLPEWLVFTSHYLEFESCGSLYILGWRAGELENLRAEYSDFCLPLAFEIDNLDDDAALEIRQSDENNDNWHCKWYETKTLDWDGSKFALIEIENTVEDTLGCAMREAEPLMWENHVAEAIPLYERGLQVDWGTLETSNDSVYFTEIRQYARLRLVLAYALVGRIEESTKLIAELQSEPQTSEMISKTIEAMAGTNVDGLSRCVAAYNVMHEYETMFFGYPRHAINIEIGRLDYISNNMENAPPDAEKAGCNAPALIDNLVTSHTFTLDTSPVEQLEALGIAVEDFRNVDLNGDGNEEWLVWTVARVEPFFFVATGNTYTVSRPQVRRHNIYTEISTHQLPNDSGIAFADWVYVDSNPSNSVLAYYDVEMRSCIPLFDTNYSYASGSLRLWRLQGSELALMLDAPLCKKREVHDLFQNDGLELHAAAIRYTRENVWDNQYDEAVYLWDESTQMYIPPELEVLPEPTYAADVGYATPNPDTLLTDAYLFEAVAKARDAFIARCYVEALTILDDAVANQDPSANAIIVNAVYYWRALTLEQLGQTDDALDQYVAIYEAVPDSAWGILAALHLEASP